jgi:hypothetical protein
MDIVAILEYERKDYQKAFDLVKYMMARSLLKEVIFNGSDNQIIAALSFDGRTYYNKNKPTWTR